MELFVQCEGTHGISSIAEITAKYVRIVGKHRLSYLDIVFREPCKG